MVIMALGGLLIFVASIMALAGVIISIIDGFKESTMWGIFNVAGMCLSLIPNLIFCLMDIKKRHVPLTLYLGSILPMTLGIYMLIVGSYVQGIQ